MSQGEVLEVLEKFMGKKLRLKDIAELLEQTSSVVAHSIKTLLKHNEIKFQEISQEQAKKMFKDDKIERRLRIYFLD